VRGYVSAYDAESGNLIWRTYTVPGDPSKPFESEAMRARQPRGQVSGGRRVVVEAFGTPWFTIRNLTSYTSAPERIALVRPAAG